MRVPCHFGFLVLFWRQVSSSFSDVTDSVGISAVDGYLAAFGDFNGDKQTDLFIVTDGGKLSVIVEHKQKKYLRCIGNFYFCTDIH